MERAPQSATKRVMVKVYLADGKTPATGKTIPVNISRNGSAFANPSVGAVNFSEVAYGWYYFDASSDDNSILGDVVIRGEEASIDPVERMYTVVNAYNAGFSGIPSAAPAANGGLPTTNGTKLNQTADLTVGQSMQVADKTGFALSTSGVLAIWQILVSSISVDGSIGKRIIDFLTGDTYNRIGENGAGLTGITGAGLSMAERTAIANEVEAQIIDDTDSEKVLKAITDKIAAVNPSLSGLTLAAIATAIRTELAMELSRIDANIGSRLAENNYTTPPAVEIIQNGLAKTTDITSAINTIRGADGDNLKTLSDQIDVISSGGGSATIENQIDIIDKLSGLMSKTHALAKPVGTFSPVTDSSEAIRDHGDIAWIGGSASQGSNTITVIIRDKDGLNVVDAAVEIYDSTGLVLYERKFSNSSGQVITNRDNGDYIVKVLKQGYSFDTTPLAVDGNTSRIITGAKFIIPAAISPELCVIYSGQFKPDGSLHQTLTPSVSIIRYSADNNFYAGSADGIWDQENNLVKFIAARGAVAVLIIPEVNFCEEITVPDKDSEQLEVILKTNV